MILGISRQIEPPSRIHSGISMLHLVIIDLAKILASAFLLLQGIVQLLFVGIPEQVRECSLSVVFWLFRLL